MAKARPSNGTLSFVNNFLDEWREMAKEKQNDINEVVSFVNDCIDKLQSITNFEVYSRETNVYGETFDMNCEMEGNEYGFIRIFAQFHKDYHYCASLTYIDDNHEIIDDQISVKKKSTIISKIQAFVDSVEQKIGK